MEQNKTGKYFKYAIGEIVLVVIGILIALSINNWNENRKAKQIELTLLTELKNELELNLNQVTDALEITRSVYEFSEKFLKDLSQSIPINDDIYGIWEFDVFRPRTISYEKYKSLGIDIISSDSLKYDLAHLYDRRMKQISDVQTWSHDLRENSFEKASKDIMWESWQQSFENEDIANSRGIFLTDQPSLSSSPLFVNEFISLQHERFNKGGLYQTYLRDSRNILERLNAILESSGW